MNNTTNLLPVLTQQAIKKILKKRSLEDIKTINDIETFFFRKRGSVFKMPPPHTPVILLLSGGLDTSIMWDILVSKYKLQVYPLFLRRGQIRMPLEEKSVNYFSTFYKYKYPKYYHKPEKLTTIIPPLEIRWHITQFGDSLLTNNSSQRLGIPTYSSLLVNYAVQYGYYLEKTHNIKTRNIFCGFMGIDGQSFKYETLTALRTNMYNICHLTNDFSWQFTSLALEKELGFFFEKETLIRWAKKNNIPIENTNSCIKYTFFHCGQCAYCIFRKKSFKQSGINDKTTYLSDVHFKFFYKFINKLLLFSTTAKFLVTVLISFTKNFLYFFRYRY